MRRSKRQEEPEKEISERVMVRREPIPSARAILWKPLPDSYHLLASMMRAAEQQTRLFVTQRAFLQVERHLASAPDLELGGFLAGHLYECPRTRLRYSIVNTVVPFADVTGDPIGVRVTEAAYKAVTNRLDAHGLVLIGWYRNGAGLGLQLLPDDIETHLAYFEKPWQTAMLLLPDPSRPKGAFFTYDPRVGRSYCIPFYELFDAARTDGERLARTCVTWKSYVPSVPVEPMPAKDREIVETTVRPIRSEPEPEPTEPIDEWWDAIKDPWVRLKDVAVSAKRRDDEPAPVVWQPTGAPESLGAPMQIPRQPVSIPASRTPNEPRAVQPMPPASLPNGNGSAKLASRPAPPFAGPTSAKPRPSARPQTMAPVSALEKATPIRPLPAKAEPLPPPPPRRSSPKPRAIPEATAAAMARAAAPPPVALSPDFHDEALRWQRRRRVGLAVAATSFLAVIALSTVRSRPQQIAQAATNGATVVDTTTPNEAAASIAEPSENGQAPEPLTLAVDSLSRAIAYYRDVEDDHRRGLVGCRVLDRAHDLVTGARARVDASRGQVAGGLDVADSLRISMVGAEYTHVDQMYARSGCTSR